MVKMNKKAIEMKIIMTWLFIILFTIVVFFLIGVMGGKSYDVMDSIFNIF
jgi:hypothetical protein